MGTLVGFKKKKKKSEREEQKRRKKKPSGVSLRLPDGPFLLQLMINALLPSCCGSKLPSGRDVSLTAEKLLEV